MRLGLIVVFVLSLVVSVVGYVLMPDQVASHFGADGRPDGWSTKGFFTVMMVVVDVFLFAMFYWSPLFFDRVDRRFISLPNRDYWLADERFPAAVRKLSAAMAEFGMATFYLMIYAKISTIQANRAADPDLHAGVFVFAVFAYLVYTVIWCVRLISAFRLPPGERP